MLETDTSKKATKAPESGTCACTTPASAYHLFKLPLLSENLILGINNKFIIWRNVMTIPPRAFCTAMEDFRVENEPPLQVFANSY